MTVIDTQRAGAEVIAETAKQYGSEWCELTLIVDELPAEVWDALDGVHIGPRTKRERVGPHTIEYRKGEL